MTRLALVLALLPLSLVAGRCCDDDAFCGAFDNSTCFANTCDNLLKYLCGVATCCSCQTSSTSDGCGYKVCTSGTAMCVEVAAKAEVESEGGGRAERESRLSTVRCDGAFDVQLDEHCLALHTGLSGSVTIGAEAYCVDDGSETCQAVWREPTPPPSAMQLVGGALYSLLGMPAPSMESAQTAGLAVVLLTLVLVILLLAATLCCCLKACRAPARAPVIKNLPMGSPVDSSPSNVQLSGVQLEKAVANQQGAIVTTK